MKTLSVCPTLTTDDIFTLRGKPMSKRIKPKTGVSAILSEEWIYYDTQENHKESYVFKDGRLVKYKMEEAV